MNQKTNILSLTACINLWFNNHASLLKKYNFTLKLWESPTLKINGLILLEKVKINSKINGNFNKNHLIYFLAKRTFYWWRQNIKKRFSEIESKYKQFVSQMDINLHFKQKDLKQIS